MMRLREAVVFFSLAFGIHAGAWTLSPLSSGATSTGGAGADQVSLAAASPAQAQMIQTWQQPPQVTSDMQRVSHPAPPRPVTSPAPPVTAADVPTLPSQPRLAALPAPPVTPAVDTAPAETPMAAPPKTRPKARPAKAAAKNKAASPGTPQPAQRAAGGAQQKKRGTGGADQVQSQSAQATNALRASWGARIHAKVQRNLRYPRSARATGTAKLNLTVSRMGELRGLTLLQSSGNAVLDQAALKAVQRAGRFDKAPIGLKEPAYAFSLSLTFTR